MYIIVYIKYKIKNNFYLTFYSKINDINGSAPINCKRLDLKAVSIIWGDTVGLTLKHPNEFGSTTFKNGGEYWGLPRNV